MSRRGGSADLPLHGGRVPAWLFRIGLALAGRRLPPSVSAPGFLGRLNRDQVFDPEPAQRLLGRPMRPFEP